MLLTIGCSFGPGAALEDTGVSAVLGAAIASLAPSLGPTPFLFVLFLFTSALSCVVSNAATVILLYHVLRKVHVDGLRPTQTMLVLMIGASCAFSTPIGYQTNLMVMKPGAYRFGDFALLGLPLTALVGLVVAALTAALPEAWL